jgi:hypothetical protein
VDSGPIPADSGPIPVDPGGFLWIPADSGGFLQEWEGHCKVLMGVSGCPQSISEEPRSQGVSKRKDQTSVASIIKTIRWHG